jgi:hypothetical protein
MGPPGRCSREFGMKWRVMLELIGPDGIVGVHEVGGRAAVAEYAPRMIGLTLEEGKHLLAALQVHLVQAQAEDHCRHWRRCQRCGAQRPLKDQRSRRLVSLFWHGGGPRAALYPMSVRGDLPTDAQSGCRDHARPMHTGVRADRRKDGFAVTLPPSADAAGGVSATRQTTGRGNHPAADPSCWHQAGAGGCRRGGIQAGGGDEIDCTFD